MISSPQNDLPSMLELDAETRNRVMGLTEKLGLPEPVLAPLEQAMRTLPPLPVRNLVSPDSAEETWNTTAAQLPSWHEDDGMAQLAVMLAAALITQRRYQEMGIPESIYWKTMGCFRRFLLETQTLTGRWAFDRGFWTWRQTSGLLFRLGTLEFEYVSQRDYPKPEDMAASDCVLSVHIPSDAVLSQENLDESYEWARRFFCRSEVCPHGTPKAILCGSWLLSPALKQLLPENSGIRRFAKDYRLYCVQEDDTSFYRWLFEGAVSLPDLPEHTGLQRLVKSHLLSGGRVGMARGILQLQENEPAKVYSR